MNGWQNLWPFKKNNRFEATEKNTDYFDMYSMPSQLLNQLVSRPQEAFLVQNIDLSSSGPYYNATTGQGYLEIPSPGAAIVIRGNDNSANQTVDTTVFMKMWLEQKTNGANYFPLKHNFGFVGPFTKVILEWPAQSNGGNARYAQVIIYKGLFRPWIDGSAAT